MNHAAPPPGSSDDLDRLLSAYFRQQLPEPWPTFPPVPTAQPARMTPASWGLGRSRLTLAASVAALLGLGLALSSGPQPQPRLAAEPADAGLVPEATAQGDDLMRNLGKDAGPLSPQP